MDEIIIREYDIGERNECIGLLKKNFAGSDENTFRWRFEMHNRKRPLLICAKHNNRVVSFNSWIPWEFAYRNNKYLGYQSGESATDLSYRGRGIWSRVLRYADKIAFEMGIDFLFGFPSKMSYGAFYKAGYYPISTNCFYVRLINPLKRRAKGSIDIDPGYFFHSKLTQFDKITPIFDYDYCKWRYTDNPKSFEVVEFTENNGEAIFFFRKKKWKWLPELLLLDAQFNIYNEKFITRAFEFIDKSFSRRDFYMRTFFNENTDKGRALRKHFNMRVKSKHEILSVKPISNRLDNKVLLNFNVWNIMPHCVDSL